MVREITTEKNYFERYFIDNEFLIIDRNSILIGGTKYNFFQDISLEK